MFTAIILMCLSDTPNTKDNCYFVVSEQLYESHRECRVAVGEVYGSLEWWDEELGLTWEPVKARCVNWNTQEV